MNRRRRLVLSIAVITFVTLGGAFWAIYLANNRAQESQLDKALSREARHEALLIAKAGNGRLVISESLEFEANDVPLTKYAALYASDGRVLAQTPSFEGKPPALPESNDSHEPFDLWHRAEHLRGVWVEVPEHPEWQLLLAAPRSDLDGDAHFLARGMFGVFGATFAWLLLVSAWLIARFARGHEMIAEVARKVAHGDLSARVSEVPRDPETNQLARDVNQMIANMGSLLTAHQHFIAHAAHELRSPLTALYGELSHGLRRPRDADAYRRIIEEALESTERLRSLAEDLLALARLSAPMTIDDSGDVVDLNEVIERARQEVALEAKAHEVTVQIYGSLALVEGRASDLTRLFRNLLENAVRHAPPKTAVELTLVPNRTAHEIHVFNGGRPIPLEDRERIFEPFVRGVYENAEGRTGAGLGLAIARQVARNHYGTLTLGDPEEGVELIVSLRAWSKTT